MCELRNMGEMNLMEPEIWPGQPYPLGASYDGIGTNFALFSEVAERVELCLYGPRGKEQRVDMSEVDGYVWHSFLPRHRAGAALRLPGARAALPRHRPAV